MKSLEIPFPLMDRMPPYPLAEVVQQMQAQRQAGADVINLGMGNPDGETPEFVVDKLCEAARKGKNHRYSMSKGIPKLRQALCDWYARRYDVPLDLENETIVTMGAKEALSHMIMAVTQPGDTLLAPNPTYPIHYFAPILAKTTVRDVRLDTLDDFFPNLEKAIKNVHPQPQFLIVSFPSNPTGLVVELPFFNDLVKFAKEKNVYVIHDLAYADLVFDGYKAPSFLQAKGAKDVGVEIYSLSKWYNMPGWRVAFASGNVHLIRALRKIKSYLDYGIFQPIQIAATVALNEGDDFIKENAKLYQDRRDELVDGLNRIGWQTAKPKATMFVWTKIPDKFKEMGSLAFAKKMLAEADVCCAPGIGFGEFGDDHVRFALIENEKRIQQAVRSLKKFIA